MKQAIHEIQIKNILTWKEKLFWFKTYFTHENKLTKYAKDNYEETKEQIEKSVSWLPICLFIVVGIAAVALFCAIVMNILEAFKFLLLSPLLLVGAILVICLCIFLLGFIFEMPRDFIIFFLCYDFQRGTLERTMNPTEHRAEIIVHAPDGDYKGEHYPRRFFEIHKPDVVIARNKRFPEQVYVFNAEYDTVQKYSDILRLRKIKSFNK